MPALLVEKENGGVCLCIDYRQLNEVTWPDSFPLPRINELLDRLELAMHISALDMER